MGRTQVRMRVFPEHYGTRVLLHLILILAVVLPWFCSAKRFDSEQDVTSHLC